MSAKHALSEYAPLVQDGTATTGFTPARFTLTVRPRRFAIEYLGFKNGTQVYLGITNIVVAGSLNLSKPSKPNCNPIYTSSSSNLAGLIQSIVSWDGINWTYMSYYTYKNNSVSSLKFACDLYVL